MIVVNSRFLTQPITGVQRFAVELSLQLKGMLGDGITFIAPQDIIHRDLARQLDVKVIGRHRGHIWEQWDLPLYLKKHGSPLLLCLCNTAPLCYRNMVVTVHDVAFEAYPQTFNKTFLYAYRFMIPRILRSANKVITVSEFSKDEIVKYYGIERNKISVVYNAVNPIFHECEDKRLNAQKYLLAVSSLNYRKNFPAILEAFSIFEKTDEETFLYVIGDLDNGNFADVDVEKYKSDSRVKFLGRVTDEELIRYYSNAAAFVYPSLYEGFGIPPLEAQSCGCPVLVSYIPPLREVVGDSGVYCNPYDVNNIAAAMTDVISNTSTLRSKGSVNVCRFSWMVSAERIRSIIEENSKG